MLNARRRGQHSVRTSGSRILSGCISKEHRVLSPTLLWLGLCVAKAYFLPVTRCGRFVFDDKAELLFRCFSIAAVINCSEKLLRVLKITIICNPCCRRGCVIVRYDRYAYQDSRTASSATKYFLLNLAKLLFTVAFVCFLLKILSFTGKIIHGHMFTYDVNFVFR